jgi:5-formyltetrahydrofolate cyclo-ligase
MMDAVRAEKERIRKIAKERRSAVEASALQRISDEIASRVLDLPEMVSVRVVHAYMPMEAGREIDTRPIIRALIARGVRIVLPVVRTFDDAEHGLDHVEWDGTSPLLGNRWGIGEPSGKSFGPLSAIDAVIVPLLAADAQGARIGHGKGYYDAFLKELSSLKVGLAMECVVFPSIPSEPHDIPLSIIVTESRIIDTRNTVPSQA